MNYSSRFITWHDNGVRVDIDSYLKTASGKQALERMSILDSLGNDSPRWAIEDKIELANSVIPIIDKERSFAK